jgi:hypothetical protein
MNGFCQVVKPSKHMSLFTRRKKLGSKPAIRVATEMYALPRYISNRINEIGELSGARAEDRPVVRYPYTARTS